MSASNNHYRTPLHAKIIIAAQFLVILFFGFWMYQEYQYNMFFQQYVNGFINDNMLILVTLFGVLGFLGTGLGMYTKSHARRSIELTAENGNGQGKVHEPSMTGGKLDTHTEQHLLDMIRKTVPPASSTSAGSASAAAAASGQVLPTLQRADDKKIP